MATIDQNLLIELQRVVAAIIRSGSAYQSSIDSINTATTAASAAQTKAATALRNANAATQAALNKRISMASKSFTNLHKVIDELITNSRSTTVSQAGFIKEIASSYQQAKGLLDTQVKETFTTWGELNTQYPKILKDQIAAIAGINLKINNYADAIKVDEYITTQQAFLDAMDKSNNKIDESHLTLVANLHKVSSELGDSFFKPFAKTEANMQIFANIMEKRARGEELNVAELKEVNRFFKSIPNDKLTEAVDNASISLQRMVHSVQGVSKEVKNISGSFRHTLLTNVEQSFGEAGPAVREAIASGDIGGALRNVGSVIAVGVGKEILKAGKAALPLVTNEAVEWMKSGTELHDMALMHIGIGQDAYLKISAQNKTMYRSMAEGQDGLDALMSDHAKQFARILGGNRALGAEMTLRMAAVERAASGGSKNLDELSKSVGETNKWATELGETTALTSGQGMELYDSLFKDSKITKTLNILKDKERIAMAKSIKGLISYSASLGMSDVALKTFVESVSTAGNVNAEQLYTTSAVMSQFINTLNTKSNTAPIDDQRFNELLQMGGDVRSQVGLEKEFAQMQNEMAKSMVSIEGDYAAKIADAIVKRDTLQKTKNVDPEELRAANKLISSLESERSVWLTTKQSILAQGNTDPAVMNGINALANEMMNQKTYDAEVKKYFDKHPEETDNEKNRSKIREQIAQKHAADAETWGTQDLSLQAGKAAVQVKNFTEALTNSQTGLIPSIVLSVVSGVASGIIGLGALLVPMLTGAVATGLGSIGLGAGAASLLPKLIGILGSLGGPILALAAVYQGYQLYQGIQYQKDLRIARVLEGTGSALEKWFTTDQEKADYIAKQKTMPAAETSYANQSQSPSVATPITSGQSRTPISTLIQQPTEIATNEVNDNLSTIITMLQTLSELVSDYTVNMTNTSKDMKSSLSSIDNITTKQYNENKMSIDSGGTPGLFDNWLNKDQSQQTGNLFR